MDRKKQSWEDQASKRRNKQDDCLDDEAWLSKSAKSLSEVKEWRKGHPKAPFVESEDEVHRGMMQLEAHVLRDAAEQSPTRTGGQEPDATPPTCPTCQVPLQARGQRSRTLQGKGGEHVT